MIFHGKVPFGRFLFSLSAGIALGYFYPLPSVLLFGQLSQQILLAIVLSLALFYSRFELFRCSWLPGVFVHIFFIFTAYTLTCIKGAIGEDHFSRKPADYLIVQVGDEPMIRGSSQRFTGTVVRTSAGLRSSDVSGKLIVSLETTFDGKALLQYGDIILVPAKYTVVQPPYNPGEFDYRRWLSFRQVYHQAYLKNAEFILLKRNAGSRLVAGALSTRQLLIQKLQMYLPDEQASAIIATLLLGYRAELDRQIVETFSNTGTMHILSVSGMHVALIYLVLGYLLSFLKKTHSGRVIRLVIILSLLWWYALLTGFSPPASRAAFMISFIVLGEALSRTNNSLNSLCISAFFLLIYNPYYLFDAGFQLSYLAVSGLILLQPKFYQSVNFKYRIPDHVWKYATVSLAAQFATLPLSIYYFHQFPLYFLLSNLLIVLPVALIMYLGIFLLAMPLDTISAAAGRILNWMVLQTTEVLSAIEILPSAKISGLWITAFEMFMLHILVLLIMAGLNGTGTKLRYAVPVIIICISFSVSVRSYYQLNARQLIFFNLNRNTAFAIVTGGRAVVFSDLPDGHPAYNYTIRPAVEKSGATRVQIACIGDIFDITDVYARGNLIQLRDFRLLVWDDEFSSRSPEKRISADAVLITGKSRSTFARFHRAAKFRWIIADGSNSDFRIKEIKREADSAGVPVFILKKSPALLISI